MFERKNRGRGRGWRRGWGSGWRRGCKPFHVHVYIHLTRMKVRKWIHMGEEGWVGLCSMMSPTTKFVYTEKGGPGSTPHHHGPKGTAWCRFSLFFDLEKGLCDQSETKETRYTSEKGGNRVSKRVHALFTQQRGRAGPRTSGWGITVMHVITAEEGLITKELICVLAERCWFSATVLAELI